MPIRGLIYSDGTALAISDEEKPPVPPPEPNGNGKQMEEDLSRLENEGGPPRPLPPPQR